MNKKRRTEIVFRKLLTEGSFKQGKIFKFLRGKTYWKIDWMREKETEVIALSLRKNYWKTFKRKDLRNIYFLSKKESLIVLLRLMPEELFKSLEPKDIREIAKELWPELDY